MTDRMTQAELVQMRERHGLTVEGLADELGLHHNAVRSWEDNKVPPIWLRVWFFGYEYQKAIKGLVVGEVINEIDFLSQGGK